MNKPSLDPQSTSQPKRPQRPAILVVGHGTRKAAGAQQLCDLVQCMRSLRPDILFLESFLELAQPDIPTALARAAEHGVTQVLVVPILLFTAGHAKSDIPDAVHSAADVLGIEVLGQTPSLGTLDAVLCLSDHRFHEIAVQSSEQGCPVGHCAHVRCEAGTCWARHRSLGRIGLAMVGRGASDPQALEHMRQLTQLCTDRRTLSWHATGFFAGGQPTVDELLASAGQADCETVIVQPHLLFEGELMDQLRSKLLLCIDRYPDRQWLLSRCLGADPGLASAFLALVSQSLHR